VPLCGDQATMTCAARESQTMNDNEALYQTAMAEHRARRLQAAEPLYRQVVARDPAFARAWHLLGLLLYQQGDLPTGIQLVEHAISLEPQRAVFYSNLAVMYGSIGKLQQADAVLRRGIEATTEPLALWVALGQVLSEQNRCDEAVSCFQRVLAQKPANEAALSGLAHAHSELGLVRDAIHVYANACQISTNPAFRILAATQLPLVYDSLADVEVWRNRLIGEIDSLIAAGITCDLTEQRAMPVFSLAHQGFNDVEIQRKLAQLYRVDRSPPHQNQSHAPREKIRIGFISSYFQSHTIGKLARGLILRLSREKFHVTVFSVGHFDDTVAKDLQAAADRYVVLSRDLPLARKAILEQGIDVLIYTDIGMDPTTYSLAFSRLAPVQCTTWGHPQTTGLPTIDYFVSSSLMEVPQAQSHYSERLVLLPALTFYFHRSPLPSQLTDRAAFGLHPTARLYACPQSIYKLHPAFDAALAGILRHDPQSQIVLIQWAYPQADELLRRRFARVMPDVADRIIFIRRLQQSEFMNFLTLVDVLLDPFPYGGGHSSLEAFSVGAPVVTLPTEFLRGRITQAFCRRLGIESCIACGVADYIDIAVRLGRDQSFREQIRQQILSNQNALFEDDAAVRNWEQFLQRVAPIR